MKRLLILASAVVFAAMGATAAVDYVLNVWISTAGTNVTYVLGKSPASLDEVKAAVKRVAAMDPEQTVHVIADEKTSMAGLFALGHSIQVGGLTNIVVSVFCSTPRSTQSNGVERVTGMSLRIHDVYDFELQEIKNVQQ